MLKVKYFIHLIFQNTAESLLRSALQGKGYSKGIHLQNGITLLPSSSPNVKDEELRRVLFPNEAVSIFFFEINKLNIDVLTEVREVNFNFA